MTHELSDEELLSLEDVRAGTQILVERYSEKVLALARGILASDAEADDVSQIVFLEFYCHVADHEVQTKGGTIENWILQRVYWRALRALRNLRHRRQRNFESVPDSVCEELTPLESASRNEQILILSRAINTLEPKFKEIAFHRIMRGLKYSDIADVLGLTKAMVQQRMPNIYEALTMACRSTVQKV